MEFDLLDDRSNPGSMISCEGLGFTLPVRAPCTSVVVNCEDVEGDCVERKDFCEALVFN